VTATRPDLQCELCGPENACTCPPCACIWCRYDRGEATAMERRRVEAHVAAIRADETRRDLRQSAARMADRIRALTGGDP